MRFLEKLLRSVGLFPLDAIECHESGRLVVSKIFDARFKLSFVTTDPILSQQYDPNSLGGMCANFVSAKGKRTIEDLDASNLVFLAGIAVDEINENCGKLNPQFYELEGWTARCNEQRYSGDMEYIQNNIFILNKHLTCCHKIYLVESFKLLHSIFLENDFWDFMNANKAVLKKSKRITWQEVDDLFKLKPQLQTWINVNLPKIKDKRSKLFKQSLITIVA